MILTIIKIRKTIDNITRFEANGLNLLNLHIFILMFTF